MNDVNDDMKFVHSLFLSVEVIHEKNVKNIPCNNLHHTHTMAFHWHMDMTKVHFCGIVHIYTLKQRKVVAHTSD